MSKEQILLMIGWIIVYIVFLALRDNGHYLISAGLIGGYVGFLIMLIK
jgi:hypothetical protein